MKFKLLLLLFSSNSFFAADTPPSACAEIRTRKELRQLSPTELSNFFNAVKQFQKTDTFFEMVRIHLESGDGAHGVPAFLPWHRAFTLRFERELQKIDSSVVLPYWDWSGTDADKPHNSTILSPDFLGGNGNESNKWCVETGVSANLTVRLLETHCLQRKYDKGNELSAFYSKEGLEGIIQSKNTFDEFRRTIETNPHSVPHRAIGGDYGDISGMVSPNDIVFFMHHSFLDKAWFEWQSRNSSRFSEYNGGYAKTTDILKFLNVTVAEVLDPQAPGNCYKYERWGTNVEKSLEESPKLQSGLSRRQHDQRSLWERIDDLPYDEQLGGFPQMRSNFGSTPKLQKPRELSDSYIKMMNLDPVQVKKDQIFLWKIIDILNANPKFVPDKSF